MTLILAISLPLFPASATSLPPDDSLTQNVGIFATLSDRDLASSKTSFIPTQSSLIMLNRLWVNCGINNFGPVATIRVYLDMAFDSVQVYFEFVSVNSRWNGVAHGLVNYEGSNPNPAWLDPPGASRTGLSVNLENNLVNAAGGGFNAVIRVWAEGSQIGVYAGECQYGIEWTNQNTATSFGMDMITKVLLGVIAGLGWTMAGYVWWSSRSKRPEGSREL